MKSVTIIVLIVFVQAAYSQLTFPGKCPKFHNPVEKTFKIDKFTGMWYAIKKFPVPSIFRCTRSFFRNNYNGTLTAFDTGYDVNTGKPITAEFPGRIFKGPNLAVKYGEAQTLDKPNFVVVGIDYTKWMSIVVCWNLNETAHIMTSIIGSRKFPMDKHSFDAAIRALENAKVDVTKLVDYDQKNCGY